MSAVLAAVFVLQAAAPAASPPPPKPGPIDCRDAAHKAFDFWVGEWDVRPAGRDTVIATSRISLVLGGCAVHEDYHQTIGPAGRTMNYHGLSHTALGGDGVWRQFYVDTAGGAYVIEGGPPEGGGMRLGRDVSRTTWTVLPTGEVRQHGEFTTDGGKTWSTGFDFIYRRR